MIEEGVFTAWFEIARQLIGAVVFAWMLATFGWWALPVAAVWITYIRWLTRRVDATYGERL